MPKPTEKQPIRSYQDQIRILKGANNLAAKKLSLLSVLREEMRKLENQGHHNDQKRLQECADLLAPEIIDAHESSLPITVEKLLKTYNQKASTGLFSSMRAGGVTANLNNAFSTALHHEHLDFRGHHPELTMSITEYSQRILQTKESNNISTSKLYRMQDHQLAVTHATDCIEATQRGLENMAKNPQNHALVKETQQALAKINILNASIDKPDQVPQLITNTIAKTAPSMVDHFKKILSNVESQAYQNRERSLKY